MSGSCPNLALGEVADGVGPASVGVSLSGRPFGASDLKAWEFERFQYVLGEGPATDYAGGNGGVHVGDIGATELWPQFNEYLLRQSIAAVFSIPLKVNTNESFGALTVYRQKVGDLSVEQQEHLQGAAHDLASTVAVHVASDLSRHQVGCGVWQMDLLNRAIGIVIAQLGVGAEEASVRIRSYSYASERTLDDVITGLLTQQIRLAPN
jgi:hypothetical protein